MSGTALGDPIEMGAILKSMHNNVSRVLAATVGALKSQRGHTEGAAGESIVINLGPVLET